MNYPKRLIEVDLPIKRISAHARREKSIRHGHISTLHIWWARRPLAACRAVICASLWPDPADNLCPDMFRKVAREQMTNWAKNHLDLISEDSWSRFMAISKDERKLDDLVELRAALLDFIADFPNWDNSTVPEYLETSRLLTQAAHEALGGEPGSRPLVVDPFAGGGAIPLEALRVGADSFASDLNPVAVLLNKVVLEFLPKYGQRLVEEFRKWGEKIAKRSEEELSRYYPVDQYGGVPIAYLWARTIRCEGPGCGAELPLIRSLWLCKEKNSTYAVQLIPRIEKKKCDFFIIKREGKKWVRPNQPDAEIINPAFEGTIKRGSATCPLCGYTTNVDHVRRQLYDQSGGADSARMYCVVTTRPGHKGRFFRLPEIDDLSAVAAAKQQSSNFRNQHESGLIVVPDEPVDPHHHDVNRLPMYGMETWGQMFSSRQLLSLTTIIRHLHDIDELPDNELLHVIKLLISLAIDRQADYSSSLCSWAGNFIRSSFGRQALAMVWDFAEGFPLSHETGGFYGAIDWITRVIEREAKIMNSRGQAQALQADATQHPLPDSVAQLMFTDPPYYDSIDYAVISDFYYVWLRRSLRKWSGVDLSLPSTPKDREIVVDSTTTMGHGTRDKSFFQELMCEAMAEGRRYVEPTGFGVVVFAHKSTSGWEAQLGSLIRAGWTITGSWPIDTERPGRMRAIESAALASSIHLVCRQRKPENGSLSEHVGDWRDVLSELPKRINEWMPRLAKEGVVGADAIFSCLGPALEIYSRYSSVEKVSGAKVELKEYLEEVWAAVSREALNMIFEGADASGFEEDARLTAMWLWTLRTAVNGNNSADENDSQTKSLPGYSLEYDAARKIAQGLGAHLEKLSHLVEIKGNTAMLLSAGARTQYLFGKDAGDAPKGRKKKSRQQKFEFMLEVKNLESESGDWAGEFSGRPGSTVLDQLHQSMILFGAGRGEAMKRFLVEDGVGRNPLFWRLAQALSALYPAGTDEKRWVDGVLARKKGLGF